MRLLRAERDKGTASKSRSLSAPHAGWRFRTIFWGRLGRFFVRPVEENLRRWAEMLKGATNPPAHFIMARSKQLLMARHMLSNTRLRRGPEDVCAWQNGALALLRVEMFFGFQGCRFGATLSRFVQTRMSDIRTCKITTSACETLSFTAAKWTCTELRQFLPLAA